MADLGAAGTGAAPTIDELLIEDDAGRWAELGFTVAGGCCDLGAVRLRFSSGGVSPGGTSPSGASPGSTSPSSASPGSASPGSASPGSASPGSASPGSASPGSASPGGMSPEGTSPRSASPEGASPGRGLHGWTLRDIVSTELDGLPTTVSERPPRAPAPAHPNGVVAIDHVVAFSPLLDRSVRALQDAGLDLRRIREQPTPAGAPRQAFFRLGAEILEVVQMSSETMQGTGDSQEQSAQQPARFWGLAVRVVDLDRTAESLGAHLSPIRPAVQPGRRIATLRRSAGLVVPLALMSESL